MSLFESLGLQPELHWINLLVGGSNEPPKDPNGEYILTGITDLLFNVVQVDYANTINTENVSVGIADILFNVIDV